METRSQRTKFISGEEERKKSMNLFVGEKMKKEDAFGIGCVWFGPCCISDSRRGLAVGTIFWSVWWRREKNKIATVINRWAEETKATLKFNLHAKKEIPRTLVTLVLCESPSFPHLWWSHLERPVPSWLNLPVRVGDKEEGLAGWDGLAILLHAQIRQPAGPRKSRLVCSRVHVPFAAFKSINQSVNTSQSGSWLDGALSPTRRIHKLKEIRKPTRGFQ